MAKHAFSTEPVFRTYRKKRLKIMPPRMPWETREEYNARIDELLGLNRKPIDKERAGG